MSRRISTSPFPGIISGGRKSFPLRPRPEVEIEFHFQLGIEIEIHFQLDVKAKIPTPNMRHSATSRNQKQNL
jgi:hypothetical protein